MSLTSLLVPTYTQMLRSMTGWIEKAAAAERASGGDADRLLSLRIAEDMYPLASQIRFVCFQSQEAVYRLRGLPVPSMLDDVAREGREAGQHPGSVADAQARITEALEMLDGLQSEALDDGARLPISLELPDGMTFDMTGEQYARDWSLPQFYFHLMTAYAILRYHGVDLGKADYVPHMFQYIRPGTMPGAS
jgi:hypothetical protein